ncbi:helix-turn-helix domain-containing protein [Virgibacillus doumboii]|uniref:helix-turn-helix domain-containing protein n=1 Tax=Virgibacillus doumboii TaxID=2697503 RepID=UPI0013DFCB11|nr:RodZ family helix-turn-helix domain-containing protein [Virgibacillus doumboii]
MEIGARLKEAREAKGLSLESLQETTKIQKRYLEAIEKGDFHILPGKFYARAFIKEYANAVGLDSNELLEEYKEEIPQTEEDSTAQYTQIHRSRKDSNPSKTSAVFSFIPTVIVVLLIIGILFAAWYFIQQTVSDSGNNTDPVEQQDDNEVVRRDDGQQDNGQAGDDNSGDNNTDSNEDSSGTANDENTDSQTGDTQEPEQPDPELTVVEEGAGSSPESTLALENASDEVTATIEATGDSWLEVENGNGESLFSGMFTSDDSPLEFNLSKEEDRIWFNVGSAPSLNITIDGVTLEYPVNAEEEVHQYLWVNINRSSDTSNE